MSLALCTSQPSAIAACRPFIEVRVDEKFVDSLRFEMGLINLKDSSESSSLVLLPLLESSQSITNATSSALKLTKIFICFIKVSYEN